MPIEWIVSFQMMANKPMYVLFALSLFLEPQESSSSVLSKPPTYVCWVPSCGFAPGDS